LLRRLAVLGALLWECGCAASEPAVPVPAETFLPLKAGRVSTFLTAGQRKVTISVENSRDRYFTLDFFGGEHMMWMLSRESEGLVLRVIGMGHGAMPLDPPLLLVPATVTEGVPWSSKAVLKFPEGSGVDPKQVPDVRFSLAGSAGSSTLAVGGKTYETRSVELRITSKGPPELDNRVLARLWLAPGSGIVKAELGQKSPTSREPSEVWELQDVKDKP
jgi:hypothetical protein